MRNLTKQLITQGQIINLLNKKEAEQNPNLIRYLNFTESEIQITCKRIFDSFAFQLELEYKKTLLDFIQIDNGAKSGIRYKIKKKKEGTKKGFPDVMILATTLNNSQQKTFFVEFKRIGNYKISDEQLEYHKKLNQMGFESYITNNPIFFEKYIVLDRIQNFIFKK